MGDFLSRVRVLYTFCLIAFPIYMLQQSSFEVAGLTDLDHSLPVDVRAVVADHLHPTRFRC